jgi:hypothetical protein
MIESLKEIQVHKYDAISFVDSDDIEGAINIIGTHYDDPGECQESCEMGNKYHIILYRDHETDPDRYGNFELFEAILTDPVEYMSSLVKQGWYGTFAKKTTTSGKFIGDVLDNIKKLDYTINIV